MENPHGNHSDVNESLMQAIVITRPLYSYVLVAFIIASLITIIWSIFGSIPQRIEGIGEIDTKRGLERINGAYGGEISEIRIKLNDSVKNGDVLFVIMRPEMKSRIQKMKISIEQLKQKKALIYSGNNKNTVIKKKVDKLGESRLKQKIKEINKNLLFFEKRISQEKEMFEKGLITYSQYFSTQNNFSSLQIEKITIEEQLNLISLNNEEWNLDINISENDISNQVSILEKALEGLIKNYKIQTEVTVKTNGVIRQLNVRLGDVVSSDFILALLAVDESKLKSYILNLYIPFDSNELITEGMDVDIQPFNIDHNLYGWLKGNVKYVSQYTSDRYGLLNDLENTDLIALIESKGAVYKIVVELKTDPNTFSGFDWSNKKGPPVKIFPGQLTLAYVNVKTKAPIDYVLPIFNDYFN